MGWETLIPLIAEYGIPLAESLWKKWAAGTPPTQADFDELRQLANVSAKAEAQKVIAQLGLAADDPKAQAVLSLVQ